MSITGNLDATAFPLSDGAADAAGLDGTAWILSALPGRSLVENSTVTIRFEDGRVQGTDGCNRYATTYTAVGAALEIDPGAASTRMACAPELMKQAEAFMSTLRAARSYRISDGKLEFLSPSGGAVAIFAAQSMDLAGTSWRVTGYNNGKQAVTSTLPGTELTLAFSADGMVSGSAGCNRYTASYATDGRKLTISPAAATRKMCADPERVMEQERLFLEALETVATARFEGNRLELRRADGALAATLLKAITE